MVLNKEVIVAITCSDCGYVFPYSSDKRRYCGIERLETSARTPCKKRILMYKIIRKHYGKRLLSIKINYLIDDYIHKPIEELKKDLPTLLKKTSIRQQTNIALEWLRKSDPERYKDRQYNKLGTYDTSTPYDTINNNVIERELSRTIGTEEKLIKHLKKKTFSGKKNISIKDINIEDRIKQGGR